MTGMTQEKCGLDELMRDFKYVRESQYCECQKFEFKDVLFSKTSECAFFLLPFLLIPITSFIWAMGVHKMIRLTNLSIKPDQASLDGGSGAVHANNNSSFHFFYFSDLKQYRKFVFSQFMMTHFLHFIITPAVSHLLVQAIYFSRKNNKELPTLENMIINFAMPLQFYLISLMVILTLQPLFENFKLQKKSSFKGDEINGHQ